MTKASLTRTRLAVLASVVLAAAAPVRDPDWPCMQRLIPTLTMASLWSGPMPAADWHANPQVVSLVDEIGDRAVPQAEAETKLQHFVESKPGAEALSEAFAGLLDRANVTRGEAIDRLRSIGRQERTLAVAVNSLTSAIVALPADAPADQKTEMSDRRALMIRQYDEIGRTIRYACEIPPSFETRLGRFAAILQIVSQ